MRSIPFPDQKEFVASVILIAEEAPQKTLLLHHKKYDLWAPPGGHIEPEENPMETAWREVLEETGIDIRELLLPGPKLDLHAFPLPLPTFLLEERIPAYGEQPEHFHLDFNYVVYLPEAVQPRLEADKALDIGWFTRDEVRSMKTFKNTQYMLDQIMQRKT